MGVLPIARFSACLPPPKHTHIVSAGAGMSARASFMSDAAGAAGLASHPSLLMRSLYMAGLCVLIA